MSASSCSAEQSLTTLSLLLFASLLCLWLPCSAPLALLLSVCVSLTHEADSGNGAVLEDKRRVHARRLEVLQPGADLHAGGSGVDSPRAASRDCEARIMT